MDINELTQTDSVDINELTKTDSVYITKTDSPMQSALWQCIPDVCDVYAGVIPVEYFCCVCKIGHGRFQ